MKRVLIILNPNAGRKHANGYFVRIADVFCRDGYETVVATTAARGDATTIARERGSEFDLVTCIGGDGTFNEVVEGLLEAGLDMPIGYIPSGTTNDFASSIGIPRRLVDAARDIVEGEELRLDIGSFNNRYFSYVASFGAFTSTSYSVPQDLKNLLGHTAYILEGIKDIPSIKSLKLTITDKQHDKVYDDSYLFGAVCNSTSMGGVLTLKEELVDMNDGKFEVLLVRTPRNPIELAQITMALTMGKVDNCPMMDFFSSSEVEVEASADIPWTLDGEYQPGAEHIVIKNKCGVIRLMVAKGNRHLLKKAK
jgi:YegS/Rv2252/BmrU family lipid kinase